MSATLKATQGAKVAIAADRVQQRALSLGRRSGRIARLHLRAGRLRSTMAALDLSDLDYDSDSITLQNRRPPQRFAISKEQQGDILGCTFPNFVRFLAGLFVEGYKVSIVKNDSSKYALFRFGDWMIKEESTTLAGFQRPEKPIIVYEFESCPYCRKVREALAMLDVDALFLPCPKGGARWRNEAIEQSGKSQFPYMVDPNTGTTLLESDAIVEYLYNSYGPGQVSWLLRNPDFANASNRLALRLRKDMGRNKAPSKIPEKPLHVWGYEASPFPKPVKEILSEYEIPYLWHTCARGSPKRQGFFERRNRFQVPYLEDPNTGIAMFESADIVQYIKETYGE